MGVPFVIPTAPNNYWQAAAAADFGSGTVHDTIPVGVAGVTSAYTLINTMYGQAGPQAYVYITFTGSAGASTTPPLVGGLIVRDYNQSTWENTVNNTSTIQVWTNGLGQRLDRQEYILPSELASQTLTRVTITDTGNENFSRAFFSGLTVRTCRCYAAEGITLSSNPIVYDPRLKLYEQEISFP